MDVREKLDKESEEKVVSKLIFYGVLMISFMYDNLTSYEIFGIFGSRLSYIQLDELLGMPMTT